jgi:phosphinothricin acetyltransferase
VTVRLATGLDAEAVAAIWNHYIRETSATFNALEKTADEVAALIGTRPAFFVALDQGRVAGFATYDQFRSGVGYARTMEHTIQRAPESSGRGHGCALMRAVEDHARMGGRIRCSRASAVKTPKDAPFMRGWAMRKRRFCQPWDGN